MQSPKFRAEDCWIVTNNQERELNAENTDLAREKLRQPPGSVAPQKNKFWGNTEWSPAQTITYPLPTKPGCRR